MALSFSSIQQQLNFNGSKSHSESFLCGKPHCSSSSETKTQKCSATEVTTRYLKSSQLRPQKRQQPSGTAFWSAGDGRKTDWWRPKDKNKQKQDKEELFFFKNFIVNNGTKTKSSIYKTMAVSSCPLWFHCWPDYLNSINKKRNETSVRCCENGDLLLTKGFTFTLPLERPGLKVYD